MVDRARHLAQAPIRGAARCRFQRQADRLANRIIADLTWPTRPRLIVQAIQPILGKRASPLANRVLNRPNALRNRFVLKSRGRQQNNLCPLR